MNCPKCFKYNQPYCKREPQGTKYTIHRSYKCKCGWTYKTTEKVLFNSLPQEDRELYLDGGRYKL
ncbi:hypothetical protein Bfsp1_8 [Cytobacillus phage Bfsp1]|nr:hypothetical protein Bfsp1_8 [Cytobacillus phage Bfsp1]